jgi:extracellular factor (EF) 3-hydroxypalmitic acid methyl ester biosynthesis protein
MDQASLKEALITCSTTQGLGLRGSILHLNRFLAVFELCGQQPSLHTSEALNDFSILYKEQTLYSGRAIVRSVINTGLVTICEATLEEAWMDLDFANSFRNGEGLRDAFAKFYCDWQQLYKILPEFKVVLADLQTYLGDLRLWLEQVELGIRSSPSADRLELERSMARELGPAVLPAMTHFFGEFERLAQSVPDSLRPVHQAYTKRQVHSLLLAAPFVYRTCTKPLGYAGDYEMVNMISRDPYEGSSLFGKLVNSWFLSQAPAEAHRNRIDFLNRKLVEEIARVVQDGRTARVFNLGCGPALEIQQFIAEHSVSNRVEFVLLDFNDETIDHTRRAIEELKRKHGRSTSVQFVKKSVTQFLKEAGKSVERSPQHQFDFVYCAGLFDYLSDQVCHRLLTILFDRLARGGLLLATNVDLSNPSRQTMEYVLDWHLIYRSQQQLELLRPEQVSPEDVRIASDLTGANIYMEVRRSTHG